MGTLGKGSLGGAWLLGDWCDWLLGDWSRGEGLLGVEASVSTIGPEGSYPIIRFLMTKYEP